MALPTIMEVRRPAAGLAPTGRLVLVWQMPSSVPYLERVTNSSGLGPLIYPLNGMMRLILVVVDVYKCSRCCVAPMPCHCMKAPAAMRPLPTTFSFWRPLELHAASVPHCLLLHQQGVPCLQALGPFKADAAELRAGPASCLLKSIYT